MKKVIFIGGTSHSGSTILDLLLSNHLNALSLGEIHALINPTRPHHFEKRRELRQKDERWAKIIGEGKKNLYKNLVELYPDKHFFIDSSKDPIWINYHQKQLNKLVNVEYKNVLIYKTPLEFAFSLWKRGIENNWPYAWKHYYKYYFSVIKKYFIVSYQDACSNSTTHDKLKKITGIEFNTETIITEQENFFGSTNHNKIGDKTSFLKYSNVKEEQLEQRVNHIITKDKEIRKVFYFLENNKNAMIEKENANLYGLVYPFWLKEIITQKKMLQQKYRRMFPDYKWEKKPIENTK